MFYNLDIAAPDAVIDEINPISDHPLNKGLVLRLDMRFQGGLSLRDLKGSNNVTLTNSPLWRGALGRPGGIGSILVDDALSQYASTAVAAFVSMPFSMGCWFRADDVANVLTCISLGSTSNGFYRLFLHGATGGDPIGAQQQEVAGGSAFAVTSTGFSLNTWHHGMAVFSSSVLREVYIDGGSKGTNSTSVVPITPNDTSIGRNTGNPGFPEYMSGNIDDVRLFNRALSATEVAEIYSLSKQVYDPTWNWQFNRSKFFSTSSGLIQYTLSVDSGSYSLTGTSSSLKVNLKLACASGSYSLTGTSSSLKVNLKLACASGSYSLTGTSSNLIRGKILACASGSYSLTGTSSNLIRGKILACASGSYAVTGTSASLIRGKILACASGSYSLTGTSSSLKVNLKLACASGSYSLTGTSASLIRGKILPVASGSYAVTGTSSNFRFDHRLEALTTQYVYTASAATLTFSGAAEVVIEPEPVIEYKSIYRALVDTWNNK